MGTDRERIIAAETVTGGARGSSAQRPARAVIGDAHVQRAMQVPVGIELKEVPRGGGLLTGEWYTAKNTNGVYFSVMNPAHVAPIINESYLDRADRLSDDDGSNAASYLVALDLAYFRGGWARGTAMPEVGWSSEPLTASFRDGRAGPEGFGNIGPLTAAGIVNTDLLPRLTAVMCGGFQRRHGVFKRGPMIQPGNFGRYFGFIENGVMFSRLQPGLATLYMDLNGEVDIRTWEESYNSQIGNVLHARQNLAPLIDGIDRNGMPIPGPFVSIRQRGSGGWSGSAEGHYRTPRTGACISEQNGRRYLIYGYFSTGTPNSMARVFQSQRCRNAIHLDMNSANQGYFGLLISNGNGYHTENPTPLMASSNQQMNYGGRNITVPRYVGKSDTTDFFYFFRK